MYKHILGAVAAGFTAALLCLPAASETNPNTPQTAKKAKAIEKRQLSELGGPDVPRFSPFDAMILATNDAQAVALANDPDVPIQYVRYISLHNLSKADRIKMKQTADHAVNSLSRKRIIMRTAGIPDNVIDPIVIRINLQDYGISPAAWDSLVENGSGDVPLPEPYFHKLIAKPGQSTDSYEDEYETKTEYVKKLVDDGYGNKVEREVAVEKKVRTGRKIKAGRVLPVDPHTRILAAGAWLAYKDGGQAISKLVVLTQTKNPIIRADWFVTYAWWAPQYYVLLGLDPKGTVDDWSELVNFDQRRGKKSIIASITDTKIVALHNRLLHRYSTQNGYVGGYVWETNDTEKGTNEEYYLNTIAQFDKPKIAAQELIGTLLNTLQAYALADDKGKLLNVAKANIAIHSSIEPTKLADKQVYAGRNCVFCHKEGIYPIKDKVRNISQRRIAMLISQATGRPEDDRALRDKIQDAFQPSVVGVVAHDQAVYTAAVSACNGLAPGVNAAQLETTTWTYHDGPITMERMAWDIGWPVEKLDAALRIGVNLDPTLTQVLQEPPELPSIQAWEQQGYWALQDYAVGLEVLAAQKHTTLDKLLEPHVKANSGRKKVKR